MCSLVFAWLTVARVPLPLGVRLLLLLLLLLQAYRANIACPNKHVSEREALYKGHLLESETYIGGKVEALESGVFRADLPLKFKCKPAAYQVGQMRLGDRSIHVSLRQTADGSTDRNWRMFAPAVSPS